MLIPIRGRYRVPKDGFEWSDVRSGSRHSAIKERSVARWRPLLAGVTNAAVEIANITFDDDAAIGSFVETWGLPVIPDENKPASMTLGDIQKLVRQLREALAHASGGDNVAFAGHFREHAVFAPLPHYEEGAAPGSPPLYVEARDMASFAWLQLGQGRGGEYRRCGWCGANFTIAGEEGHRRSRQFCSDRCRVAAHRSKKR